MTTTAWAHLPNAAHIDRVIASAKANPDQWEEVRPAARYAAWQVVRVQAWDAAWHDMNIQHRQAAWAAGQTDARNTPQYAILALCAYDDCAYMLDSDPGELAILAKFGDHRAVLLLSACKAFHSIKESA